MEANVPDRDELGRFTAWAKKKGGEAIDSIRKGAGDAARSISVGADKVADELGAAPRVRPGMETDDELESAEPKNLMMKRKVRTIGPDVPAGPAKKPSYKPWNMESKKGW